MSWDPLPLTALAHLDLEDDIESVSRRGSFSLQVDPLKVGCICSPGTWGPKVDNKTGLNRTVVEFRFLLKLLGVETLIS